MAPLCVSNHDDDDETLVLAVVVDVIQYSMGPSIVLCFCNSNISDSDHQTRDVHRIRTNIVGPAVRHSHALSRGDRSGHFSPIGGGTADRTNSGMAHASSGTVHGSLSSLQRSIALSGTIGNTGLRRRIVTPMSPSVWNGWNHFV